MQVCSSYDFTSSKSYLRRPNITLTIIGWLETYFYRIEPVGIQF